MGKLIENIKTAVAEDRFVVSWHADERCEQREVSAWQLAVGIKDAKLIRERLRSKPHPSVIIRQTLSDGTPVEVIWAWLAENKCAKLITVYFQD